VHRGDPPELFKPRAPVVCEGHWARGLTFDSDRILIKHGAQYTPPKVNADKAPKAKS
jgi:cytochrome c-type biogenesis protein CcmE